jgi:GT2 family glycosyltransferase
MPSFVSLVIAVYNQIEYTRQCLASIEACTTIPYELILVDNGSTDGTRDFLQGLRHKIICNEMNLGCAKAWNQGIRASKADVIGILNNDILVTPGWLENLLAFMERTGHGIVSPSAREGQLDYDLKEYAEEFTARCRQLSRAEIYAPCMVIRREVLDRIGLFDEAFAYGGCEDTDFLWRAQNAGFSMGMTGSVLIHHFVMVTQDAIKKDETAVYPKANLAHFEAKWGRTVRGNWINRRWESFKKRWQSRYERFQSGHTLIEKPHR